MAIYALAQRTTNSSVEGAQAELIAGTRPYRLLEWGLCNTNTGTCTLVLGIPSAIGLSPSGAVALLPENIGDTSAPSATLAIAWGTPPVQPQNWLYRKIMNGQNNASGSFIWAPKNGLWIPPGGSLGLFNMSFNGTYDFWVVVEQ